MFQENQSLLGVSDLDSSEWQAYTDYVDRMILAGFSSAVRCSLQYLMDNTDAAQRITPLFEVQLAKMNGTRKRISLLFCNGLPTFLSLSLLPHIQRKIFMFFFFK